MAHYFVAFLEKLTFMCPVCPSGFSIKSAKTEIRSEVHKLQKHEFLSITNTFASLLFLQICQVKSQVLRPVLYTVGFKAHSDSLFLTQKFFFPIFFKFFSHFSLTGYSPTSGTWIFPWFFWNQIFYRSFVGVRLSKLIHPTWHPWVHHVGSKTNLKARNFQKWPTLRASIALFRIDNANKNKSIGSVIDSISHVKLKKKLPLSRF